MVKCLFRRLLTSSLHKICKVLDARDNDDPAAAERGSIVVNSVINLGISKEIILIKIGLGRFMFREALVYAKFLPAYVDTRMRFSIVVTR